MGNLSATEVADTVELWTAPCTVAAARMAKVMAVFIATFSLEVDVLVVGNEASVGW